MLEIRPFSGRAAADNVIILFSSPGSPPDFAGFPPGPPWKASGPPRGASGRISPPGSRF